MKTLFLTTLLSSLIANSPTTVSVEKPKEPQKCPSLFSVASQGLDYVAPLPGIAWLGVKENSRYDTNDNWTFVMFGDGDQRHGRIAIQQLTRNIKTLESKGEPKWENDFKSYICEYTDDSHRIIAGAVTPGIYE